MGIPTSGDVDFDAADFRAGITFAMQMGAPPAAGDQAVFYFPSTLVYSAATDDADVPFDPNATVVRTTPTPARDVPCSIEYFDAAGQPITFGTATPSRITVLLLDADHAQVAGCSYVVVGGVKYDYVRAKPPSGLFDVGLFELIFKNEADA